MVFVDFVAISIENKRTLGTTLARRLLLVRTWTGMDHKSWKLRCWWMSLFIIAKYSPIIYGFLMVFIFDRLITLAHRKYCGSHLRHRDNPRPHRTSTCWEYTWTLIGIIVQYLQLIRWAKIWFHSCSTSTSSRSSRTRTWQLPKIATLKLSYSTFNLLTT